MLRSAASLVLRSALVSIATAACLVSAAWSATLRLCCAIVRAVCFTACSAVFGCALAMRDNARGAGEFGAKREKRPACGSALGLIITKCSIDSILPAAPTGAGLEGFA